MPGFRPETLRVVAGEVVQLAADSVTFRLQGRPGERVVFAFRAGAPVDRRHLAHDGVRRGARGPRPR